MSEYRCEHRGCASTHAMPQFTKSIQSIKGNEKQPSWFCEKHAPLHSRVTFWGEVVHAARKEVKRGAS